MPDAGERTTKQGRGDVASAFMHLPGYGAADAATFKTYREMRGNPTVAIARIAAQCPIRGADWSYEAVDAEGLPRIDEAVALIRTVMDRQRSRVIKHMLSAYDYGFASFEKVFGNDGGRIVIERLKPLLADITKPLEHKQTGALLGVRNGDVNLFEDKSVIWSYDAEPGNHWGRSRHENIRTTAYNAWRDLLRRQGQYITKVAGAIPMIEYEPGESQVENGEDKDNFEIAQRVLENLSQGLGVAMPRQFSKFAEELIRSGANFRDLQAWSISFLESAGSHGSDFVQQMKHHESLMLRGWLVPERAVTEGQFGTKAEAGEHADLAIAIAELDLIEIGEILNEQVVDQLLALNFGNEYCGKVVMKPAGLSDDQKAFTRNMISTVLTNPMNMDMLVQMVDLDAMLDETGLPKTKDVVSVPESITPAEPGQLDVAATLSLAYQEARITSKS